MVIELYNNSNSEFKYLESEILHGDKLLNNLPDVIDKNSINYICHGSNGIMTGVQASATFINENGILLKLIWESDYIGKSSFITIETNNYNNTKTELEDSNKNNLHFKVELQDLEINCRSSASDVFDFINGD